MFFAAARALADQVTDADLQCGRIFPAQERLRAVAAAVAAAVADIAFAEGLASRARPAALDAAISSMRYEPAYPSGPPG